MVAVIYIVSPVLQQEVVWLPCGARSICLYKIAVKLGFLLQIRLEKNLVRDTLSTSVRELETIVQSPNIIFSTAVARFLSKT